MPDAVTAKKKVSCKVQWDCSGAGRAPTRGAPFLVCLTAEIVAMAPAARAGATGHEGGREDCPPSPGTAFERDGGGGVPRGRHSGARAVSVQILPLTGIHHTNHAAFEEKVL